LYQSGKVAEVEPFLEKTLERVPNPEKITVLNELAGFYRGVSRYEDSAAAYLQALVLLEAAGQKDKPTYSTVLMNLAGTLRLSGKLTEAAEMFETSLRLLDPKDYAYASAQNNLALVLQEQGKFKEAEKLAEQALEWVRRHGAPAHEVTTSLNNLANIRLNMGDTDGAKSLIDEALGMYDSMGEADVHHAAALSLKGSLCCRQKDWDGAQAAFEKALSLTEHFFGKNAEYEHTLRNLEAVQKARDVFAGEGAEE